MWSKLREKKGGKGTGKKQDRLREKNKWENKGRNIKGEINRITVEFE